MPDSAAKVDLKYAIGLKPEDAIKYFSAKGYTISWHWWDTWQEAHAKAFTVAKAARMDILQDIRSEVQKAIDEGRTFQQFKKDLEPRLKAKGWWGKKMVGDGQGGAELVQLGSPYRLKTIYLTNMQTAYNAGRYKAQMENTDDRPYWQYTAVLDARTRPAHRALNGQTFRYDDPFWSTHYPPLGFRCRCRVRALSGSNVESRGITVESAKGRITWEDALVSKRTGALEPVAVYHDPNSGKAIPTDVGWSYNPGQAWLAPFTPRPFDPQEFPGGYKTVGAVFHDKTPIEELPAKPLTKDMLLTPHQKSKMTEEGYISAFLSKFGAEIGKPVVYKDVIGDPVVISDDLFRDRLNGGWKVFKANSEMYLPMLADTIKDPVEIWLIWVQGKSNVRLCKRYIGIYKDTEDKIGGFAVFDLLDDIWQGTTVFNPRKLRYIDDYREGALLYIK